MKKITENKEQYRVIERRNETHNVVTLKLVNNRKRFHNFTPGQFITVYFPDLSTPEGKSYSISSTPNEQTINITVKAIGVFSNKLYNLKEGSLVTISAPYGFFFSEENKDMIIFAGGIGIAPFRSIIKNALLKNPSKKIVLNLSNKTVQDIVFKDELDDLSNNYKNFKVNYYITKESKVISPYITGRIDTNKIIQKHPHNSSTEYFICGSISFVRDFWKNLRNLNIPEDAIYTEAFFSH